MTQIRFGAFQREAHVQQLSLSANSLAEVQGNHGGQASGFRPDLELSSLDVRRLVFPYISTRAMDQIRSVVPLALYLMLFQIIVFRQNILQAEIISLGLIAVILGLMLFMEGLKVGLMPFGEMLGNTLPAKATLPIVLAVAFMLGIGVTFAEPAIGALKIAGQSVSVEQAPIFMRFLITGLKPWCWW